MMLRRIVISASCLCVLATSLWANAKVTVLMDALKVTEVAEIMRVEGLSYAEDIEADMLAGQGGAFWRAQVQQIYDPARMTEMVREAIEGSLDDAALTAAVAFFDTPMGQQIVTYENAARDAMRSDEIDEEARGRCMEEVPEDAAHRSLIDEFVAINDLIERNVAGALSSNYRFYLGLADGNTLSLSEGDILRDVYDQEADIRAETENWLCAYLLLAYRPLPLEGLANYVDFYRTDAGKALNAALFDGYETMYRDISYALGRAVAMNSVGDDI